MWNSVNAILYNKTEHSNKIHSIAETNDQNGIMANKIYTDPQKISNVLNKYFGNIGKQLYEQNEQSNSNNYVQIPLNNNTIYIKETSIDEIKIKIQMLKPSESINDIISSNMLKKNADKIAPILCKLINNSITVGEFPNSLKTARIIPIYKDGNPQDPANYRPINILSPLSKIFEMILYDRFNGFIDKFKIINENQYGFQEKSGTLSATANVLNHIQIESDSKLKKIIGCVFIDLRKAFDTVPHNLLLQKFHAYGIRGKAYNIIKSYFKNRKHYTDIYNTHSEIYTKIYIFQNPFSVQQGSNLGPLLFLVFINDIFRLKLNGKLIMFADDAILIVSDNDHRKLQQLIQEDLDRIYEWLVNNKLSMNIKKNEIYDNGAQSSMKNLNIKIKIKKSKRLITTSTWN